MNAVDLRFLAPERCERITANGLRCAWRVKFAGKRLAGTGKQAGRYGPDVLEWDDIPDDEIVWACVKHTEKLSREDAALRWRSVKRRATA